jgi:hypothetical protein
MYVCMYVCMYIYMYVYIRVHEFVHDYVCMLTQAHSFNGLFELIPREQSQRSVINAQDDKSKHNFYVCMYIYIDAYV